MNREPVHLVARDMALVTAAMSLGVFLWAPGRPRMALGVLGGGALVGLSLWAIAGVVRGLTLGAESGEFRRVSRAWTLVKLFTRHAILAVTAYIMMVRLRLDPVGMFVGVTSVVVAAAFAAARQR
ncbi:MAG TPA: hypothetical protein VMO26_03180 [Vicinamibacterales bacterium]|nr:hypothetical protein [Vicinamibacterales bacterium]